MVNSFKYMQTVKYGLINMQMRFIKELTVEYVLLNMQMRYIKLLTALTFDLTNPASGTSLTVSLSLSKSWVSVVSLASIVDQKIPTKN